MVRCVAKAQSLQVAAQQYDGLVLERRSREAGGVGQAGWGRVSCMSSGSQHGFRTSSGPHIGNAAHPSRSQCSLGAIPRFRNATHHATHLWAGYGCDQQPWPLQALQLALQGSRWGMEGSEDWLARLPCRGLANGGRDLPAQPGLLVVRL